jgi:hypothetical protein
MTGAPVDAASPGAPAESLLSAVDREALARAVRMLERPSFAMKLADAAGQPINRIIGILPKFAFRALTKPIEAAIFQCLEVAIQSLDELPEDGPAETPSRWLPRVMSGLSGGVAGFFGAGAMALELPVTTTFMLRSIAEIARHNGEDIARIETRMACLEVFALGDSREGRRGDVSYYATRAVIAKLAADVAALAIQRGAIDATSPVVMRMVTEIASRFGVAVSERVAATAVPVVGAVGGAAVNIMFMEHFQHIAEGHFLVRRMERLYGAATIRAAYATAAARLPHKTNLRGLNKLARA